MPPADAPGQLTYPPVAPGFPVHSADDLLAAHDDLIRRIKLAYGADHETFSHDLMAVMRRYAGYVNLLPATPDNYFSGPGGLLRLGLEIAFYALQATDGQIFSGRSTITNRRHLEPRWRHATFIAGLCSEIHRPLSQVLVTDDQGNEWPAYLVPLTDWLHAQRRSRFFVRWVAPAPETRPLGVFALPHIIPADTLHHLAQGNAVVVPDMMACISGMPGYRNHNMLDQLVRQAAALVIERNLQASADRYGKPQWGAHLPRYLVDAFRRLVLTDRAWMPNADKSRVWYGQDGLYLVWPNAAADVISLLEADRLPGMPKSPATLLEILIDAGMIAPCPPSQSTWRIYPPEAKSPIDAIKLTSPAWLFAPLAVTPTPLPRCLLTPGVAPAPSPAHTPRPGAQRSLLDPKPGAGDAHARQRPPAAHETASAHDADTPAQSERDSPHRATAGAIPFCFHGPLRLNPALRSALMEIVDTLNGSDAFACCRVPAGLFVPLAELERRQIEPAMAIRTLADLSMLLTHAGGVKTVSHDCGGDTKLGIVLSLQYISGFDGSAGTVPPSALGSPHAGPQL